MSLVHTISQLIAITERVSPKARKSKLWRQAAAKALRAATSAEYHGDAREGPQEEEEWEEGDQQAGINDLNATLNALLPKPRTSTSKGTKAKTNVVSLTRSRR